MYILCIKRGEGGASAFALGDDELNARDDELALPEVAGEARAREGLGECHADGLGKKGRERNT